jgi:hypothetical protein
VVGFCEHSNEPLGSMKGGSYPASRRGDAFSRLGQSM